MHNGQLQILDNRPKDCGAAVLFYSLGSALLLLSALVFLYLPLRP